MWVMLAEAGKELEPLVLLRDTNDTSVGTIRTLWAVLQQMRLF